MKPRTITYEYKVDKLPDWAEKSISEKADRKQKWAEECRQLRITKATKQID